MTERNTGLDALCGWLAGYYTPPGGWAQDTAGEVPGSGAVCAEGRELLARRQDIQGGEVCRWRSRYRVSITLAEGEQQLGHKFLEGLRDYTARAMNTAPRFGNLTRVRDSLRCEGGALEKRPDTGLIRYSAVLVIEYEEKL